MWDFISSSKGGLSVLVLLALFFYIIMRRGEGDGGSSETLLAKFWKALFKSESIPPSEWNERWKRLWPGLVLFALVVSLHLMLAVGFSVSLGLRPSADLYLATFISFVFLTFVPRRSISITITCFFMTVGLIAMMHHMYPSSAAANGITGVNTQAGISDQPPAPTTTPLSPIPAPIVVASPAPAAASAAPQPATPQVAVGKLELPPLLPLDEKGRGKHETYTAYWIDRSGKSYYLDQQGTKRYTDPSVGLDQGKSLAVLRLRTSVPVGRPGYPALPTRYSEQYLWKILVGGPIYWCKNGETMPNGAPKWHKMVPGQLNEAMGEISYIDIISASDPHTPVSIDVWWEAPETFH
jgi:hypothetical protein